MLSRVADSIYWMSRYIERAENVARFIDVNLNLMLDLPVGSAQQWQPLVETTGDAQEFARRSTRFSPASAPPARTRVRCVKSSPRRCGNSSTSLT